MRPKIIVTLDQGQTDRRGVPFDMVHLKSAYVRAVEEAGGLPLLVAPTDEPQVIASMCALTDGLVVTGGAFDIPPEAYGGVPGSHRVDPPKPLRTRFETALTEAALAANKPVLGICGGMQLINVVMGGTLLFDIASQVDGALEHEQATSPAIADHDVTIEANTKLASMFGPVIAVNTTHHQAVDRLAPGLLVQGRSVDGVIEAIAHATRPIIGVQWHPELLGDPVSAALYRWLVDAASR